MRTIAVLCCAALALGACGKSSEERLAEAAIESATGQQVSIEKSGEQVTMKTADGEVRISSGAGAALPAAFPEDVYLPKTYTVRSVVESTGVTIVGLDAEGEVAQLYDEAASGMTSNGWEQVMAMQDAGNRMLVYQKEKRTASMTLAPGEDRVEMTVQLAEEKD
ncbi:MAG TPA: hypothetical protein VGE10_05500 [Zeimonas sp.]